MAEESLKITIGADVSEATDAIKILSAQFERLQKLASLPNLSFKQQERLNAMLKKTGAELASFQKAAAQADPSVTKLQKSSAGATQVLSNMGRVVQDLPFGFIGIANNIEPLLQSFSSMQGGAKALFGALAGPTGLIFGFSIVSSSIQGLILKYGSVGRAMDALISPSDALTTAQRDLSKAFEKAQGEAAGEIAKVNALLAVARDETQSKVARKEAINELNKEYDEFLPKLSLENINTQLVTDATNKLTASILRQAKIKGIQDLISKETQKQAELLNNSLTDQLKWYDLLNVSIAAVGDGSKGAFLATTKGAQRTNEEFDKANQRIKVFNDFLKKLIGEEAVAGTLFTEPPKKIKKAAEETDKFRHAIFHSREELEKLQDQLDIVNGVKSPLKSTAVTPTGPITPSIVFNPKAFGQPLTDAEKALEDFNEKLKKQMQDVRATLFEGLGASLGEALAGGGFGSILSGILQVVGDAAIELGKLAIAVGVAMTAIKNSFKTLGGPGAIAAGVALIALGSFAKAKAAKIPKFAEGGIVTQPTLGLFGEAGPEAVIPLHKAGSLFGGQSIEVTGRLVGDGKHLVAVIDKATRSLNRIT